jgi:hypothetical protein
MNFRDELMLDLKIWETALVLGELNVVPIYRVENTTPSMPKFGTRPCESSSFLGHHDGDFFLFALRFLLTGAPCTRADTDQTSGTGRASAIL